MFIGHIRAGHIAHGDGYDIFGHVAKEKRYSFHDYARRKSSFRPRAHSRTDGAFLIYPQVTPESGERAKSPNSSEQGEEPSSYFLLSTNPPPFLTLPGCQEVLLLLLLILKFPALRLCACARCVQPLKLILFFRPSKTAL